MRRVLRVLLVIQQFFKDLLAGSSPGDLDGDVEIRPIARQTDQITSQIENPHRLAHIKEKYLAVPAHKTGLENKLYCLRNRHKVACHLWVCDSDRAASGDLTPHGRDYGAA